MRQHLKSSKSQVYKHKQKSGLSPIIKDYLELIKITQLTDYIEVELAKSEEGKHLETYLSNGWVSLNVQETGNLGGFSKISKENCEVEIHSH